MQTVGIVGWGDFGRFLQELTERFLPGVDVRVYSRTQAIDNVQFFPLEGVCACDVVVLCVPIHSCVDTLEMIVPLIGKDTIVVDVATVKEFTASALESYGGRLSYIATHPMFGPYSYEKKGKSVAGFRLVIAQHNLLEETVEKVERWLESLGLVILHLSPEEHDRMLAETLFLTHLIAQGVVEGGFKRTEIDTVSFGFLMDAVESVKHDTKLFRDVYRYNPYCKEIPARLVNALAQVSIFLEQNDRST